MDALASTQKPNSFYKQRVSAEARRRQRLPLASTQFSQHLLRTIQRHFWECQEKSEMNKNKNHFHFQYLLVTGHLIYTVIPQNNSKNHSLKEFEF